MFPLYSQQKKVKSDCLQYFEVCHVSLNDYSGLCGQAIPEKHVAYNKKRRQLVFWLH